MKKVCLIFFLKCILDVDGLHRTKSRQTDLDIHNFQINNKQVVYCTYETDGLRSSDGQEFHFKIL
jgi:hypothetical protein